MSNLDHIFDREKEWRERQFYRDIVRFMNPSTRKLKIGIKTLAKKVGCCKKTIIKYIKIFVAKGIIHKKKVFNYERMEYEANEYTFLIEEKVATDSHSKKSLEKTRKKLLRTFKQSTVEKAYEIYDDTVKEKGKVHIDNADSWLRGVCKNIIEKEEQQHDADNDMSKLRREQVKNAIGVKSKGKSKNTNSSTGSKGSFKTKFHFKEQRSDKYTDEELERMILKSQEKKFKDVGEATEKSVKEILAKYQK